MKKKLNVICAIVCFALLIVGIIFVSIGVNKGGKLNFYVDYKNKKVEYFDNAIVKDKMEVDAFDKVVIDMHIANVTVVEGDTYSVEYSAYEDSHIQVEVNDGVLNIKDRRTGFFDSVFSVNHLGVVINFIDFFKDVDRELYVIVTVPKGNVLDNVELNSDTGNCRIDNIEFNNFSAKSNLGNVRLVNSKGNAIDIVSDTGNVKIEECEILKSDIKSDLGNVDIKNSIIKNLYAQIDVGNIKCLIKGSAQDYDVTCKTDTGNVKINGEKVSKDYSNNGNKDNVIKLISDTGNIIVTIE